MRYFFKVIKFITEYKSPVSITIGIMLGYFLALTPTITLQWVLIFIAVIIFRVNILAVLISFIIFLPFYYFLSPIFEAVGLRFLFYSPSLYEMWSKFYSAPIIPYTFFHDSIVLGSLIVSVGFSIPFFLILYYLLKKNYVLYTSLLKKSSIYYWYINTKFYRAYLQYESK